MTEQDQLSLEEMLQLARKIPFWEEFNDEEATAGGAYHRYKGHIGNLTVEVASVYRGAPMTPIGVLDEGEVTAEISVYGLRSYKDTYLGAETDKKVFEILADIRTKRCPGRKILLQEARKILES